MKIEKIILLTVGLCLLIGIPLGVTLRERGLQLKEDMNHRRELQGNIERVQLELNDAATQIETKGESLQKLEAEKQRLEQEKAELEKKLEAKAKQKVVVARAQAATQSGVSTPAVADCEQYRSIISAHFPASQVENAMRVMRAESGCRNTAENATDNHKVCLGSRGLFQIGCVSTPFYAQMFEAEANIRQAAAMYKTRGWQPWSVSRIPGVIQ